MKLSLNFQKGEEICQAKVIQKIKWKNQTHYLFTAVFKSPDRLLALLASGTFSTESGKFAFS